MENTIFIAQFLGLFLTAAGLGIFFNMKRLKKILDGYKKSPALTYSMALFTFILGSYLILVHNIWSGTTEIVVTCVSWAIFIKGAMLLIFPEVFMDFAKSISSSKIFRASALIILVLGLYLLSSGFGIKITL